MLAILIVLIALVARVDAAPGGDPIDAIRDANAASDAARPSAHALAMDEDGDRSDDSSDDDDGPASLAIDDDDDDDGPASLALGDDDAGGPASFAFDDEADRGPAGLALGDDDDAGAPASLALGDDDDAGAPASLALDGDGDGDGVDAWSAGPGALAMLDAELAPGDATAGLDAADAAATAGADEIHEQQVRHRRPSPWGRLDVGVSWRRRWSQPIHTPANRHDEVWLVATWRR